MTKIKNYLHIKLARLEWLLITQFGLDPRKMVRAIWSLPFYILSYVRFRVLFSGVMASIPCLHDVGVEGGATKSEYFWLDLIVARRICKNFPEKHVDIGSRVDGFVAHVASFREIEVFDIRPLTSQIPGVIFQQADFMTHDRASIPSNYCDSLSCLHALEHFGLGRYGDPLDPMGYEFGIANMSELLKPNGIFYLAVPLGLERVEFNANRVFSPHTIIDLAFKNDLEFINLLTIGSYGPSKMIDYSSELLDLIGAQSYTLGLFEFRKIATI